MSELEPTGVEYDPDDTAPWNWNLEPGSFEADRDWAGYLNLLKNEVQLNINRFGEYYLRWCWILTEVWTSSLTADRQTLTVHHGFDCLTRFGNLYPQCLAVCWFDHNLG